MSEIRDIVIIGAGNVATQLAYALEETGQHIAQVFSRTESSAKQLADQLNTKFTADLDKVKKNAGLYIISLTDEATQEVAGRLKLGYLPVIHTSGSLPLDLLNRVSENYGVLYPLQTLSKQRKVSFEKIPLCIEANTPLFLHQLKELAGDISGHVVEVDSDRRKVLHLAAVFASNFPNFMYHIAGKLVEEKHFSFDILRPLISETANKVADEKPAEVQTGPAIRGDQGVMELHDRLLIDKPELREIYRLISREIMQMKNLKK
jgi:predicted short-subunit dehydrogenase-like oxidoreductase (DUF2520 family)